MSLIVLAVALALGAMATPAHAGKTMEQKDWVARQKAQPLTFTVPDAQAATAWLRAKTWIATHGKAPIQTADENVIQTQSGETGIVASIEFDSRPQLTITRVQQSSGDWTFAVSGRGFGPAPVDRKKSLQALAFHVASGEPYPGDAEGE